MKTNRFFTAILSVALCVNFVSCGDDEDNNIIDPENAVKRLISISYKDQSGTGLFNIEYSGEQVSKVTDTYKSSGYSKTWVSNYTYTTNGVTEKVDIQNSDGEDFSKVTNYTLNDKGYVEKGEMDDGGIWSYTYSGDYMTSAILMFNGRKDVEDKYNFNDKGLMVSNDSFDKGIEYTDIPNQGGLFLAYTDDALGLDYCNLQYASLLGKAPKYLPKECIEYGTSDDDNVELTFHYELDEDGYVKKVEVKNLDGSETWWTETYTYERVK